MATLLLTSAVSASSLTGFSMFAATLAASAIGGYIDSRLFPQKFQQEGPKLEGMTLSSSTEGAPIKRLYGTSRIGGNLIWVTNFYEQKNVENVSNSGKGGTSSTTEVTTYTYSISFAVAFCEGNANTTLGRIWADSDLLETGDITFRWYPGSETQGKDSKIVAVEGDAYIPAFRGVSYIVFEDLQLEKFGNRIPQITAEITVPITAGNPNAMENIIQSVNLIPSTGEQSYATTPTVTESGGVVTFSNTNLSADKTDFVWSIENLKANMPNVASLNLVIAWFGTDLRLSNCEVVPKVEFAPGGGAYESGIVGLIDSDYTFTQNTNDTWIVNGMVRSTAEVVSYDAEGNPVFGGTPTDWSVYEAITYLMDTAEIDVHFYPFLLMDIPSDNTLPDTDGVGFQPAFPWRGRITTSTPSVDKTAAAATEMNSFMGSVARTDFSASGKKILYTGSVTDFGYRRMIFHYAHLCANAASNSSNPSRFKTFYIGSELVGINRVRDGSGNYVGVNALIDILGEVRAIFDSYGLTGVELSYAADWSEYHSHQDGTGDINFPLDSLWAHSDCDHVAIDNYLPISDWREGSDHLDYGSGTDIYGNPKAISIYNEDYLKGQIEGGEYYDYYYASDAARESQTRTAIFDGAYGKHWIFRTKDIRNWWNNVHYPRVANVEAGSPTAWTAAMKRIRFSEFGTPAVDKGSNQPNVFYDPKSSESFLPYFSTGARDDQMQRSYYEAIIEYWTDNAPTISGVKMIDPSEMCAWTWDARPYPAYPFRRDIWSDGDNWNLGHWLNGRAGSAPLAELVKVICGWVGFEEADLDVTQLLGKNAVVTGYVVDGQSSPRNALNPLFSAYLFDGFESQGKLKFILREFTAFEEITTEDMVVSPSAPSGYEITRAQETEMPKKSSISFINQADDYQLGTTSGSRQTTSSEMVVELRFPIVFNVETAKILAEMVLQETWSARESMEFQLSPEWIRMEPGDGYHIDINGRTEYFRFTGVSKGETLEMQAETVDVSIYDATSDAYGTNTSTTNDPIGRTSLYFMDLPLVTGDEPRPWAPRLAAFQDPYPPLVNVYESTDGGASLSLATVISASTLVAKTVAAFPSGPHNIIDEGNTLSIELQDPNATLVSSTEELVRNGANAIAIQTSSGNWEVLKFVQASLVTGAQYNLTRLFRGQLGTWPIMEASIPAGAPVVFLDPSTMEILPITSERKFDAIDWHYGPSIYGTASAFYLTQTHTGQAVGELPYPVADVQFFKTGVSDVLITWKRQTRFGGEGLDAPTVPLNEDEERYQIDLLTSGDVLITTVEVTSPEYQYTSAPANFKARIYQMSNSVGRGRQVIEQSPF